MSQFGVPSDLAEKLKTREVPLSRLSPYLAPLHDRFVIGVNNAYAIGDWIDVVFFGDKAWYQRHFDALMEHPAEKVTCCPNLDKEEGITFMPRDQELRRGISSKEGRLCWNLNSGAAAINLAYQRGFVRVILIGFDMDMDESGNHSHWHGRHWEMPKSEAKPYKDYAQTKRSNFQRHLRCFPQIADDAAELGLEIINANPDSQITAFPRRNVSEVLDAR